MIKFFNKNVLTICIIYVIIISTRKHSTLRKEIRYES